MVAKKPPLARRFSHQVRLLPEKKEVRDIENTIFAYTYDVKYTQTLWSKSSHYFLNVYTCAVLWLIFWKSLHVITPQQRVEDHSCLFSHLLLLSQRYASFLPEVKVLAFVYQWTLQAVVTKGRRDMDAAGLVLAVSVLDGSTPASHSLEQSVFRRKRR